jgi:hypothetical protein
LYPLGEPTDELKHLSATAHRIYTFVKANHYLLENKLIDSDLPWNVETLNRQEFKYLALAVHSFESEKGKSFIQLSFEPAQPLDTDIQIVDGVSEVFIRQVEQFQLEHEWLITNTIEVPKSSLKLFVDGQKVEAKSVNEGLEKAEDKRLTVQITSNDAKITFTRTKFSGE